MWSAVRHALNKANRSLCCCIISERHISSTAVLQKEENLQGAYADLVRYFTYTRDLEHARKLHGKIVDRGLGKDRYLLNLITEMYGKCHSFEEAKQVFDQMGMRDQMSWTAMITASAENDLVDEAVEYYRRMLWEGMVPDSQVLNTLISCVDTVAEARKMHNQVISSGYEVDMTIMTGILNMYRRSGRLDLARRLFDSVHQKDLYFWTSMLSAYSHSNGYALEALKLFWSMELEGIRPDRVTFISLIAATSSIACACYAKCVHERVAAHGLEKDLVIASALLHMHGRSGNLDEARRVFNTMPEMNTVTWNSMIAASSFYGQSQEALHLYRRMDHEGFVPDHVTFASVLDACADLTALDRGRAVHDRITAVGLDSDMVIVSALLNLYGKCGKVEEARKIFDGSWKNLSCWNSMITAYAQNGHIKEMLQLFLDMCHQGLEPDDITFVCLVAGCGHAGKMDIGRDIFRLFLEEHQIEATVEHYGCMIDMLGRNGKLQEAEELLDNMPFYPDVMAWTAILRSCKSSKDFKRGARLAEAALESYPEKSGPYILLSQMQTEVQNMMQQQAENGSEAGQQPTSSSSENKRTADILEVLPVIPACACAVR